MKKWESLNMELRSWVISHVLRLEQASSDAIRAILRMFNEKSKTLGNQSSALSLRSKIDLLLDLEEINAKEYNHLIKLMEIRNQFAHNASATSFESLDDINDGINNYLIKFDPLEKSADVTREERLKASFSHLFTLTAGTLLVVEMEYSNGIHKEMRKHLNNKVVEGMDQIWQNAIKRNKGQITSPTLFFLEKEEDKIAHFYSDFKISMSEFMLEELKKIDGNLSSVFKQKETPSETLTRKDKHKGD